MLSIKPCGREVRKRLYGQVWAPWSEWVSLPGRYMVADSVWDAIWDKIDSKIPALYGEIGQEVERDIYKSFVFNGL